MANLVKQFVTGGIDVSGNSTKGIAVLNATAKAAYALAMKEERENHAFFVATVHPITSKLGDVVKVNSSFKAGLRSMDPRVNMMGDMEQFFLNSAR